MTMSRERKTVSRDVATTASDGPHRPNQYCADGGDLMEGSGTKDNAATAERRTTIYPTLVDAIAASQCRLAPRPGLEPGTCGLTVRRSEGKFYCFINCLQRPRNLTVAVECSAMQGYAKRCCYVFVYRYPSINACCLSVLREVVAYDARASFPFRMKIAPLLIIITATVAILCLNC